MNVSAALTERQRKSAEATARKLIVEWTNDTLKTGRAWTPERIAQTAHYWTGQADVPYGKRDEYARILIDRLADNFDVDMDAYHAEQERLREAFAARMDELDAVYQRDTRPCLEGKPSVKVVMTKDGPQALLPTFDPPPAQKGADTQQLALL